MRYALRYRATYDYRDSVPFGQHVVRVLPTDCDGQRVESASRRWAGVGQPPLQ